MVYGYGAMGGIGSPEYDGRYYLIPHHYYYPDRDEIVYKLTVKTQTNWPGSVTQFIPLWLEFLWYNE